jgi:hypothetical protein
MTSNPQNVWLCLLSPMMCTCPFLRVVGFQDPLRKANIPQNGVLVLLVPFFFFLCRIFVKGAAALPPLHLRTRGGVQPLPPEIIPKFWQSRAELPVPWKIHHKNLITRVSPICKLGGTPSPQIPVLSALCPQLNLLNTPTEKKFLGTPLLPYSTIWISYVVAPRFVRIDSFDAPISWRVVWCTVILFFGRRCDLTNPQKASNECITLCEAMGVICRSNFAIYEHLGR